MSTGQPIGVLRRWTIRTGWAFALGISGWIAFGLLWKDDPATDSRLSGWLAFAALFSDAFRFHLGFAVFASLIAALIARGRSLAVVLAALLIPTLGARVAMLPDRDRDTPIGGPRLSVLSANLLFGRGDDELLLAQIRSADPDIVLLQEYTPGSAGLAEALAGSHPHAVELPRRGAFGMAVFSKRPFVGRPDRSQRDSGISHTEPKSA
ncbi:MAG: endonuclease/exonuclease/phosphatase family protein [Planctomycetota bacterium]